VTTWLVAAGDFVTHGGMDAANHGLARYLASRDGDDVHLVAHRVAPDLIGHPRVQVHHAPRPFGMHTLGEPLLRRTAKRWAERLRPSGATVIANGGNVDAGDVSWVHYVHAAYSPVAHGPLNRLLVGSAHRRHLRAERDALGRARVIVCNSRRTAADVAAVERVNPDRVRVVYYGIDATRFRPATADERAAARQRLGLDSSRPVALFAGALGDRRKGFDTVFAAWRTLCATRDWDVDLVVAGTGAELAAWAARAQRQLPPGRLRFIGFQQDMRHVFAASDVLVHPSRYEAYGLAVHEALCCGLPAIVSASAGVAERYPDVLRGLLLQDPNRPAELAERLRSWRGDASLASHVAGFGERLRSRSWDDMGQEIAAVVEGCPVA
jgi:glycosyltransferase involved in cell wall biosynthesis